MSRKKSINNKLDSPLFKAESFASQLIYKNYQDYAQMDFDIIMVENLMCNGRCHLVALFKNYLIEDDKSEYLRRFYKKKESPSRLKKLFAYHDETSVIFPNYIPLVESKYLYNNVIKKQRVIDEQQSLDKIRNDNKLKKSSIIKKEDRMFNSTIFGEILTSNQSVLRIIFGLDEDKKTDENKADTNKSSKDESICEDFDKLVKEVEKAEENAENNNSLEAFKLTNKASKYKLKLVNNQNSNYQSKNKSNEKQYNVTNNSTNMTSSSNINNITNKNLKNYKKNNLLLKDNTLTTHINLKINKKQKNLSLNKTSPNKKYSEDKNFKKNNNFDINSKTLYGINFHSNNKIISNLVNKEKKINLKINSNSTQHQNSNSNNNKINSNIFKNNYIFNNNFPHNLKINEKNINFYHSRNNQLNLIVKSYKDLGTTKIPKIDMDKVYKVHHEINSNTNRNNNYILNNPNLLFTDVEALKSERNQKRKKNAKKENIRTKLGTVITFSPLKLNTKNIIGRNNNTKIVVPHDKIFKSMNHKSLKDNQYLSNNNQYPKLHKTNKNFFINEYNYKSSGKNKLENNYINKFLRK